MRERLEELAELGGQPLSDHRNFRRGEPPIRPSRRHICAGQIVGLVMGVVLRKLAETANQAPWSEALDEEQSPAPIPL